MLKSVLAETLKAARQKAQLSQDKLAANAGVSLRYYQRIESGDNTPTVLIIFKLAHALGMDSAELLAPVWEEFKANPNAEGE